MKTLLILILSFIGSIHAEEVFYETSYDCTKRIVGSVDYKICQNQKLAYLDAELNWIYKSFTPINKRLKQEQRKWSIKKNQCQTTECIEMLYRQRINELYKISSLVVLDGNQQQCQAFLNDLYKVKYVESHNYEDEKRNNPVLSKCDASIQSFLHNDNNRLSGIQKSDVDMDKVYYVDIDGDEKVEIIIPVFDFINYQRHYRTFYVLNDNCHMKELYISSGDDNEKLIRLQGKTYLQATPENHFFRRIFYISKRTNYFSCSIIDKKSLINYCENESCKDYSGIKRYCNQIKNSNKGGIK